MCSSSSTCLEWTVNMQNLNKQNTSAKKIRHHKVYYWIGGFNPFEKYQSKWDFFPNFRGKKKKCLSCHHKVYSGLLNKNCFPSSPDRMIRMTNLFWGTPTALIAALLPVCSSAAWSPSTQESNKTPTYPWSIPQESLNPQMKGIPS